MNVFGEISLVVIILSFFFSVFLIMRPRGEKFLKLDKKWIAFGGLAVVLLAITIFYVAGFQTNNVVQTLTVNGVSKDFVVKTMDLPGGAYFDLAIYVCLFSSLVYIVAIIRELSLTGVHRENRRSKHRS